MVWPTEYDLKLADYDSMELPGQQLEAARSKSRLDHMLNLGIKLPAGCQRLTGIVATIGKSCNDVGTVQKMMAAGMNIALLNLSFGTREEHIEMIKMLRRAAKEYSVSVGKNFPLAIAVRLPGRKIRTGHISDIYGETVELKTDEKICMTTDEAYKNKCSSSTVYVDFKHLTEQLKKGDVILLDNETIQLKVEVISTRATFTCKVERGGFLGSNKDVFIPSVSFKIYNNPKRDKVYIDMAVEYQLDIIIASFMNSSDSIVELKNAIGGRGKEIAIVANIQTMHGYQNFDEILKMVNGIMITRQELGSDISPKMLVLAQKNMISLANKANVPICINAQLLSSMRYNKFPHRVELLDIANCILDGADALVLSAETAIGVSPVEAVVCMASACKQAETSVWTMRMFHELVDETATPCDQSTAVAISAVLAAYHSIAAAIIVVTASGKSAFQVAKYRPRCPIIAVTRYPTAARQMHLYRGIMPLIYEGTPDTDWETDLDQRINFCAKWAMQRGFVRVGDPLILVSAWKRGSEFTNTMRMVYAKADIEIS